MAVMMAENAPGPQAMRPMQKQLVIGFSDIICQNGARTFPRKTYPRLAVTQNAITQNDKTQTALNPDCL